MQKVSTFDVARQNSLGTREGDERQAVLAADWTSSEDKDAFINSKSAQLVSLLLVR